MICELQLAVELVVEFIFIALRAGVRELLHFPLAVLAQLVNYSVLLQPAQEHSQSPYFVARGLLFVELVELSDILWVLSFLGLGKQTAQFIFEFGVII